MKIDARKLSQNVQEKKRKQTVRLYNRLLIIENKTVSYAKKRKSISAHLAKFSLFLLHCLLSFLMGLLIIKWAALARPHCDNALIAL